MTRTGGHDRRAFLRLAALVSQASRTTTARPDARSSKVLLASFSRPGENDNNGGRIELEVGNTQVLAGMISGIKTTPDRGWFAYFRIYGPEGPAFDGSWRLPSFEPR